MSLAYKQRGDCCFRPPIPRPGHSNGQQESGLFQQDCRNLRKSTDKLGGNKWLCLIKILKSMICLAHNEFDSKKMGHIFNGLCHVLFLFSQILMTRFFIFRVAFVWVVFYLLFPDGCWCPSGRRFISSSAPNGALLLLKNKSEIASFLRVRTKPAGGDLVNVAQSLKSSQLLLWKIKQGSDWGAPIRMDYPFCYGLGFD